MLDLNDLRRAVSHEGGISRRLWLAYGAALASLPSTVATGIASTRPRLKDDPFSLGVASGDPDAKGFVIWTRLAPMPFEPYGGMQPEPVEVSWEVAEDEAMSKVVASGKRVAMPQLGHSVHVELKSLKPNRWYWYRFRTGDAESRIGRARTLPRPNAMPEQLRFAFASCQHLEQGHYTAYEQMAKDDLDLVFHLGDYIYEYKGKDNLVRKHIGNEIESLGDYRVRLAQYRSDPLLMEMHRLCPWFVTWDDHEFDNNYANLVSEENGIDPAAFLERRMNSYQAYYEMMPLRSRSVPKGPHLQLYRRASFGRLAEFMVLDTRQYRTDQPNGDRRSPLNENAVAPENSILGSQQRNWLTKSLISSKATWNVLAQQVMMGMVGNTKDDREPEYSMDQWPGYARERMDLVRFLGDRQVPNPVVLTGDIHSNWVNNLRVDDRNPETEVIATEFVGTSISSGGNGVDQPDGIDKLKSDNPCVQFHNRQRGYVRCHVTPGEWKSDYLVVDQVTEPGGIVSTRASFVVENGTPGAKPA